MKSHDLVPCPNCQKLMQSSCLKNHLKSHERMRIEYKCEICWKVYRDKTNYLNHTNECRQGQGEIQPRPKHKCQLCGKMLASKKVLKKHKKFTCPKNPTKMITKRSTCHLCSKLVVLHRYNTHIISCTGTKAVRCYFCQKRFAESNSLYEHLRSIHMKEKPFSGKQCRYRTGRASDIHGHVKIHNRKLVPCYFCYKTFSNPKAAGIHIQTIHIMEKSFKCGKCPKRFKTQAKLTRHLNTGGRTEVHKKVHGIPERKNEVECPKCFKLLKPQCLRNHLRRQSKP